MIMIMWPPRRFGRITSDDYDLALRLMGGRRPDFAGVPVILRQRGPFDQSRDRRDGTKLVFRDQVRFDG